MNWDDPVERAKLIEHLGASGYADAFAEHVKATTIETINGYIIRPVGSRFGTLYTVDGTSKAYGTLEEAKAVAATLTPRGEASVQVAPPKRRRSVLRRDSGITT